MCVCVCVRACVCVNNVHKNFPAQKCSAQIVWTRDTYLQCSCTIQTCRDCSDLSLKRKNKKKKRKVKEVHPSSGDSDSQAGFSDDPLYGGVKHVAHPPAVSSEE